MGRRRASGSAIGALAGFVASLMLAACSGGPVVRESAVAAPAGSAPGRVELRADGLGIVAFGMAPDAVVAALTDRWGRPDLDTGWEPGATSRYGSCPGRSRGVEWNKLFVLFSDGDTGLAPAGQAHFFAWMYGAPGERTYRGQPTGLSTPDGLSSGSTLADLRRIYGSRLDLDPQVAAPRFTLRQPRGRPLSGLLSGTGPAAEVALLAAGAPCVG